MPPASGSELPPVPDDDAPPQVNTQSPWSQIPKFIPGTTNVQEYTQKLKFLAAYGFPGSTGPKGCTTGGRHGV
jgi:hypothetical protein